MTEEKLIHILIMANLNLLKKRIDAGKEIDGIVYTLRQIIPILNRYQIDELLDTIEQMEDKSKRLHYIELLWKLL